MDRRRLLAVIVALAALAAGSAALAWAGCVPGGWRLRRFAGRAGDVVRLERRAQRIAEFERERGLAPAGAVVFLGSSTIERFPLERAFPRAAALNRGIADEPVRELIERLPASLPDSQPAAIVVYAGAVDLRRLAREPSAIAEDVRELLDETACRAPGVPVCLLGILPERDPSAAASARRAELDRRLGALAAERSAVFVATARAPIADERGGLTERFSSDALHLNDEGYAVLSAWIFAQGGAVARALLGGD